MYFVSCTLFVLALVIVMVIKDGNKSRIDVSATDSSKCFTHVKYLPNSDHTGTQKLFPTIGLINESNVIDYRFVFDNSNPLEEPVYFLHIKLRLDGNNRYCSEVNRIQTVEPLSSVVDSDTVICYDNHSVIACRNKKDSVVWDGCLWNISFATLYHKNQTIEYYIIHVCDAESSIDQDIMECLDLLNNTLVVPGDSTTPLETDIDI